MGQPASFYELRDTPFVYTSQAYKLCVVNAAETAIEFENRAFVTLTDAANIAVNASLGSRFKVTITASRTLSNPTNPRDGKMIIVRVKQDGTGGWTLAYDTKYRFGQTVPQPVLSTAPNKTDYIGFIYHEVDDKWDCIAFAKEY